MLTGISVITSLEVSFWFIRFFSRCIFKNQETKNTTSEARINSGKKRFDALEKRNAAIERRNEVMEKEIAAMKKKISREPRARRKAIGTKMWPSFKI